MWKKVRKVMYWVQTGHARFDLSSFWYKERQKEWGQSIELGVYSILPFKQSNYVVYLLYKIGRYQDKSGQDQSD